VQVFHTASLSYPAAMRHIRAVCFDLDDTLWDMGPVIPRAEKRLYKWFVSNYPRVTKVYTPERLHRLRHEYALRYPELHHDLTELRLRMLRQVFREADYAENAAAEAFEVFQQGRNSVDLFADVEPVLESLAVTHDLYAFTNGNAALEVIGIRHHFTDVVTARELGVAKPDTRFFSAALEQAGLSAVETRHVGDHPENDIQAAAAIGMQTLWLNRNGAAWELDDCAPDHEMPDLSGLPDLLRA